MPARMVRGVVAGSSPAAGTENEMADSDKKIWSWSEAERTLDKIEKLETRDEKIAVIAQVIHETRREALSDAHWASLGPL
jgi:hypothetical protein